MRLHARKTQGYSLIELLVVLAILGFLSIVGVATLGNRRGASVRSLLDEMEGALSNARAAAVATSRDTALDCWGNWSTATPAVLAFGDASISDTVIQSIATGLLANTEPSPTIPYGATVAVPFHYMANDATQSRARVVVFGSTDWALTMSATSSGAVNEDITTVAPFNGSGIMSGYLTSTNNFFNPSLTNGINRQVVSGNNQRFTTTLFIEIVGTSPSGGPLPGGPMGVLIMQANGASIYKFYNPGVLEGDGQWRRI